MSHIGNVDILNRPGMARARAIYLDLAASFGWRRIDCAPDGVMASEQTVHQWIMEAVGG